MSDGQIPERHGDGIEFADGHRFHPGVALGFGFDSNVFRTRQPNAVPRAMFGTASVWSVVESRRTIGGQLDVPLHANDRVVEYHFGAIGEYRYHITRNSAVRAEANKFNLGARAVLLFAPSRPLSFRVSDEFHRYGESAAFVGGGPNYHFDRKTNDLAIGVRIRPGGGRLSLESAFNNTVLWYDSSSVLNGDRVSVGVHSEVKWRFVDRSAVFLGHRYDYYYYSIESWERAQGANQDSNEHQLDLGFRGQIGRIVYVDASVGFRDMRFIWDRRGPHFRGVVFDAQVAVLPGPGWSLRAGLARRARNALLGNFRVDLNAEIMLAYSAPFGLDVDLAATLVRRRYVGLPQPGIEDARIERYGGVTGSGHEIERLDDVAELRVGVSQDLGRFMLVGLRYQWTGVRSDFSAHFEPRLYGDQVEYAGFRRNLLQLIFAVRY